MNRLDNVTADLSQDRLWNSTVKALDNGDFSWLEELLTHNHNASIVDLLEANGNPKQETDEAFTWACFTGRTLEAEILLDKGTDPAAGFKTGLTGFHWAANRGNFETVTMLIKRGAPLEQVNMYGGTVLGCALYSAVHEPRERHAEIIGALIKAGAEIETGTLEWWNNQDIQSPGTKKKVADSLVSAAIKRPKDNR